ncbi:MAG: hypothetical protein WKF73_16580 [Nocardioidaceae bacterium]
MIQAQIGATNAAGMDVFAACSGFLYGLTMVESMIRTGQIKYALVIGAEVLTKYVDYTDRSNVRYFWRRRGRGGAWRRSPKTKEFWRPKFVPTDVMQNSFTRPAAERRLGTTHETIDDGQHFFKMKGNELFKVAVRSMAEISTEMLEKAGYTVDDVDLGHSASGKSANHRCRRVAARACRKKKFIRISPNTAILRRLRFRLRLDECIAVGKN